MNMHTSIRTEDAHALDLREPGFVRRNAKWLILTAVVLIAAFVASKVFGGKPEAKPSAPPAPSVTVIVPGQVKVADLVTATGTVAARREMPVGVQGEGGMVRDVLVNAGDYVRAGQVLARIDRSVQSAQLAQMQAQSLASQADARVAQSELDRAMTLVGKGFISKADIDRKTSTRDSARARAAAVAAQAREMGARLARLDIRAPADGLVLARAIEPGQIVGVGGQPLFRIAKDGAFELQAKVAEQDIARLKVGLPAQVTPVGATTPVVGNIWLLEPSIDPATRLGVARIALPRGPSVRSGGFAAAQITAGAALRPVLPQSAVMSDTKGPYVYVVDGGNKVARRDIVTGEVGEQGIAVASGLTGRERIVQSAGAFLNPGETVAPVVARTAG